jgi:hypothetical protein
MYGIEAKVHINHEWFQRLSVELTDYDHELFIVDNENEATLIQKSLISENKLEELHLLIALEHPAKRPLFSDYGFVTETQSYLLAELVCAFSILNGLTEDIEMAKFQIEEHLIATETWNQQTIYYVDNNQKELIQRFSAAYNIEVSFLDLDK